MTRKRPAYEQDIEDIESPDAETREYAAYRLGHTRSKRSITVLIKALDDPEARVRSAAASVLGDRHSEAIAAIPKLIDLLKDPVESVRFQAADALGEIGDARAVEPLIDLLHAGDDAHCSTARALCKLGYRPAVELMIEQLGRSEDALDRESIWLFLGSLGHAPELRHLSRLLHTEGWSLQPEDRRALLDPPSKPLRRLPPKQVAKIKADIEELTSADEKARHRAVARLGRRRGQVVEYLAEATASPNTAVRHWALHALGRAGDPRAFPVVLEMTRDPVPDTRWCALEILGKLGKERAIPVLIEVLRNLAPDYSPEQDGAPGGLAAVGKPAVPALIDLLETGGPVTKEHAARTLVWIGDEAAVGPLSKLLDDPDALVRLSGVWSLGMMGEDHPHRLGHRCLTLIEPLQNDPDERVRESASHACRDIRQAIGAAIRP